MTELSNVFDGPNDQAKPMSKTEDNTEIYAWINGLSEKTGLGVDTLSDLYLKGFIVAYRGVEVEKDGTKVPATEIRFWKRVP